MRKIGKLLIATLVVLLASCGGSSRYEINVVCDSALDGQWAYLVDMMDGRTLDSVMVEGAKCNFVGEVEEPFLAMVGMKSFAAGVIVEPGVIQIDATSGTATGTPMNDDIAKTKNDSLYHRLDSLLTDHFQHGVHDDDFDRLCDSLMTARDSRYKTLCYETLTRNQDNIVGAIMLGEIFMNDETSTLADFEKVLSTCGPVVKNHPFVEQLKAMFNFKVGGRYPDFEGVVYDTKKAGRLSDLIAGKYAIVDFWASWCGPCRAEISENLIRIYEKYKNMNVVVVGVDVNDDPSRHDAATKQLGIPYPQILDTKGEAMKCYSIDAIPQVVLIDQNGTIVAKDLRGEAIEEALKTLIEGE